MNSPRSSVAERRHAREAKRLAAYLRGPIGAAQLQGDLVETVLEQLADHPETQARLQEALSRLRTELSRIGQATECYAQYIEAGDVAPSGTNIADAVDDAIASLGADDVEVDMGEGLPMLPLDRESIVSAVAELVDNARIAAPAGTTVSVQIFAGPHGGVVIEVVDAGDGVAEADRARLFELFHSTRGGHVGVGLALARRIAEAHGGTLECVPSEARSGATFRLSLPAGHRP